jgi:hypothetical protein
LNQSVYGYPESNEWAKSGAARRLPTQLISGHDMLHLRSLPLAARCCGDTIVLLRRISGSRNRFWVGIFHRHLDPQGLWDFVCLERIDKPPRTGNGIRRASVQCIDSVAILGSAFWNCNIASSQI